MKKIVSLTLGIIMMLSIMNAVLAEEQVTISIWCSYAGEDPHGKYIYEYADVYMKENPNVKIDITAVSSNDIYTKLAAMTATPDDIPTLFYTSADQAPPLVDIGMTEDISKYLSEDEINAFGKGVVEGCTINNIMAYYPLDLQPLAMLYRTDRFEEKGLRVPETWDDFLVASEALTIDNDKNGEADEWGFSMVGSNNSSGQSRFMAYLWSQGNQIVYQENGTWKSDMDTDKFLKDFTFWTDMNNVKKVVPIGISEVTYPVAANYFAMGYTSIMLSGGNALGVTYTSSPDLKGKVGTFKIPGPEPGTMMNTEGYALYVKASDAEKAAALDFCKFFASNDKEMKFWQISGKLPATTSGLASDYLQGPDYAGFLETIEAGCRPVNPFPGMGALKGILGNAYAAVFSGEKTNEQAVETLIREMNELLEDYN